MDASVQSQQRAIRVLRVLRAQHAAMGQQLEEVAQALGESVVVHGESGKYLTMPVSEMFAGKTAKDRQQENPIPNALISRGIKTVGKLITYTESELANWKVSDTGHRYTVRLGSDRIRRIKERLAELGLSLAEE